MHTQLLAYNATAADPEICFLLGGVIEHEATVDGVQHKEKRYPVTSSLGGLRERR